MLFRCIYTYVYVVMEHKVVEQSNKKTICIKLLMSKEKNFVRCILKINVPWWNDKVYLLKNLFLVKRIKMS